MKIVLASQSPYKAQALRQLGIQFEMAPPCFDEKLFNNFNGLHSDLALTLARGKAESLVEKFPGAVIIGADQLVSFEGEVLGKPGTKEKAIEQLLRFSGNEHELFTAVSVWCPKRGWREHVDRTALKMKILTIEQVKRYVAHDQPIDCAGSYKIEKTGIGLFERIESEDFTSIVGLPLLTLGRFLSELGYLIP